MESDYLSTIFVEMNMINIIKDILLQNNLKPHLYHGIITLELWTEEVIWNKILC